MKQTRICKTGTLARLEPIVLDGQECPSYGVCSRLILAIAAIFSCFVCTPAHAQSGLRESLERLDVNKNGSIEPDEVTPLARPYLERITKVRRMSLDRPNEIHRLQEAARIYHALQNGVSGGEVDAEPENSIKTFEPTDDQELIPQFGLAEVKFPYTQDDLDFADRTLGDYDRDGDGYISRIEAYKARRWTHRNPFADDLNKDDRLSRMELTQRYARRRLLDDAADELRQKAWRTGGEVRPSGDRGGAAGDAQRSSTSRYGYTLTATLLSRFDINRSGRLEAQELESAGIPAAQADMDRDGVLSRDELITFVASMQEASSGPTSGLPDWFYDLDSDHDDQVSMAEFATQWSDAKLQEFAAMDANTDGLLTALEVASSKSLGAGEYANSSAEAIPPRKTIVSEIEVDKDFIISDVNVKLSISHSYIDYLDAYLTGPDGQRIELVSDEGGSGDHFDQTIFDDQAAYSITRARAPFRGSFVPEAVGKRQPSLSHFNGKNARGIWQLTIRAVRSDRFGMLHNWSLLFGSQGTILPSATEATQSSNTQTRVSTNASSPQLRTEVQVQTAQPKRDAAVEWAHSLSREDLERLPPEKRAYAEKVRSGQIADKASDDERRMAIERYKAWLQSQKSKGDKKPSKDGKDEFRDKDRGTPSSK